MNRKGFTLIEAVLTIVILAASFVALSQLFSETTVDNIDADIATVSTLLARETMAETMAQDFADVVNVTATSYSGNFASYSYQVSVGYVDAADLNTTVAGPTDYKRVTVTVANTDWPGNITLNGLKADL